MNETLLMTLKIAAVVALVIVAYHLWPGMAALLLVVGLLSFLILGVAALGATVVLSVAGGLLLALLGIAVALALGLAPIWLPILAVVGLVALVRRGQQRV